MNNFKYICNTRMLLHDHFYNNIENINFIIDNILKEFDLFSINYNSSNNSIELKIKKTNIRKNVSYSHTATYYYEIFNPIFLNIFMSNRNYLSEIFRQNSEKYNLVGDELDFILDMNNVGLLFNLTTLSDNIVILYL